MKRVLKTALSVALTVVMMFTAAVWTGTGTDVLAKTKAKASLTKTKITMKTSATSTLKVKNYGKKTVKWSSTNTKIVRIKKKSGKHKQTAVLKAGKKAGSCYIKAKVGNKTLQCKVTVKKRQKPEPVKPEPVKPEEKIEIRPLSDSSKDLTAEIRFDPAEITASPDNAEGFSNALADFSVSLLQHSRSTDLKQPGNENTNILVSPDSVLTALMMTENGATGQTLSEMQSLYKGTITPEAIQNELVAMHTRLTTKKTDDDIIYELADSIWARDGEIDVDMDFLRKNKSLHNASYYLAPFSKQTIDDMNSWVYNNTRNMIDNIIKDLSDDAVMVLINALAFEGKWIEPFEDYQINKKGKFTDASGNKQTVTMLSDVLNEGRPYVKLKGADGFAKMYQGGKIAFMGILPPENTTADDFLASLTGADFIKAWNERSDQYDVDIMIPEFKDDYECSLRTVLEEMGMERAFTDDAEFSKMITPESKTQYLKVADVLHKTHIELDKNGTKAAAATAVVMEKASAAPIQKKKISVHLDRPFIYALVDTQTGIPLFIGMENTVK